LKDVMAKEVGEELTATFDSNNTSNGPPSMWYYSLLLLSDVNRLFIVFDLHLFFSRVAPLK
jgi:hypothetical protein